jgi:hypothetical protein
MRQGGKFTVKGSFLLKENNYERTKLQGGLASWQTSVPTGGFETSPFRFKRQNDL